MYIRHLPFEMRALQRYNLWFLLTYIHDIVLCIEASIKHKTQCGWVFLKQGTAAFSNVALSLISQKQLYHKLGKQLRKIN